MNPNPLHALAALLLGIGGLATIVVGAWAAFTHQPWLAAGACIALLALTASLRTLAIHWTVGHGGHGETSDTDPWSGHDPGNEQPPGSTVIPFAPVTKPENET